MARKTSDSPFHEGAAANGAVTAQVGGDGNGTMTKADAVRACMRESPDMPTTKAVEWIKEQFDLEMDAPVFSSYRSQMRAREEGRNGSPRKAKATRTAAMLELLAAVRSVKEVADPHGMAAIRDVLGLVSSYEAGAVGEMMELLEALGEEEKDRERKPPSEEIENGVALVAESRLAETG
jgi:hypothetical protein